MTATTIRGLRKAMHETVDEFGHRFAVSGRTVENWEHGRHQPDALARRVLEALRLRMLKQQAKATRRTT